jgi:hypothetical protein
MGMRGVRFDFFVRGCIGYRIVTVPGTRALCLAALAYTTRGCYAIYPLRLPPRPSLMHHLCCAVLLKSTLEFGELGELGLRKRKGKKENPPT